jgi:hypothetical protein
MIVHERNRNLSVSAAKAPRLLNWKARPDEDCIRATAQSLIDHGSSPRHRSAAAARPHHDSPFANHTIKENS